MPRRRPKQLDLPIPATWGGKRRGAGRKPSGARSGQPHRPRAAHDVRQPLHATLRALPGLPSLRREAIWRALRDAIRRSNRASFRVLHFSVQSDHLHLIAEADSPVARRRGLWGLAVRTARAINRRAGRKGRVWSDRYHARSLGTPREVRRAITYVLLNFCKHLRASPGVDPRSSGPWFDGWTEPPPAPADARPVALPRTWLGATGWRRAGGQIGFAEAPERNLIER
jgi:REP-associated tyrosine transposase